MNILCIGSQLVFPCDSGAVSGCVYVLVLQYRWQPISAKKQLFTNKIKGCSFIVIVSEICGSFICRSNTCCYDCATSAFICAHKHPKERQKHHW